MIMPNFAESFLTSFVPSFQRAQSKRSTNEQTAAESDQLQNRNKLALLAAIGENVRGGAMSGEQGNRLLAAMFPEFQTQRQVEGRVSAPINQPPVEISSRPSAEAPNNLPMMGDLPSAEKRPYTRAMTPVGLATAPRGGIDKSLIAPATGYDTTREVTEPQAIFQDLPAKAEKRQADPLVTEAAQSIFTLLREGKVSKEDGKSFLGSYQTYLKTGNPSDLKLPTALAENADPNDEAKLKKLQLDLTNRSLDIQKKQVDLQQKQLDKETPFRLGQQGTELTLKLQDRAQKQSEEYQTVVDNLSNINAVLDRLTANPQEINRIATDQAVITSFNKILDPRSVVRESEYERTEANQALVRRAQGWLARLSRGGTTLGEKDLTEIKDTAQAMAELRRTVMNKKLEKLRGIGKARGLEPDEFAPLFESTNKADTVNATNVPAKIIKTTKGDISEQDISSFRQQLYQK